MNKNPYFDFVQNFFVSYGCSVVQKSDSFLKIQLTSEMDEEIMNRPFYWHYMKKMNRAGEPMQLTFTHTDRTEEKGIYLHAGTPKLHTLYKTAIAKGKTSRLYESIDQPVQNRALTPWLVINLLLHFRGKQAKDERISIGLNLIHGTLLKGMMERIWNIDFHSTVSDYTFPMTPVIGISSAYRRIEQYVENHLSMLDDQWAKESLQQMDEERELLNSFYESEDIGLDYFTKEQEQIDKRYRPRVQVEVVNGGLFYISQLTSQNLLQNKKAVH
ncbi:YqhG family protein [Halobacillus mangrovi]|uniref:YqhG n=1 Tax=Halobacillus mangrovi TaxID=402384 RepID=A0A1W5ZUT9_9BACI|nr:YqhG family protein [Halobacillus mangrovi]ARI77076.1 hypothetical protein HM131_09600 [Halobacillus mangrovi]